MTPGAKSPARLILQTCMWMALVALHLSFPGDAHGQEAPASDTSHVHPDSVRGEETSWFAFPNVFYTPETSVAGGVVGGYFFRWDAASYPSSFFASATITARGQLVFGVAPELYTEGNRRRHLLEVAVQDYPDVFFGVGADTPDSAEEEFTARRVDVRLLTERRVWRELRLGLRYRFRYEEIEDISSGGLLEAGAVPGSDESLLSGVGGSAVWDSRDNLFYPRRGTYAEAYGLLHADALGSDSEAARFVLDGRRYHALAEEHVLALRGYGEAVVGTLPFTTLPVLGGVELMRGYREGRFRDDVLLVVQGAYRFPIWGRLRGEVFGSVGDVYDRLAAIRARDAEATIGTGLRFRINPEEINIRVDAALGREGGALYFTIQEAF